ncbi:MAG: alpha/beta hydrolase [Hyphomicrobiales bacterium]
MICTLAPFVWLAFAMVYKIFKTQEALDAAYDVENSVPDFMVYARQYTSASENARANLPCALGVKYGPTVEEYVDIFPASQPGAPVLVFIHGGYWRMLTAREFSFVAQGFSSVGVTVVVANYTLCPAVSISEISRQMRALVAWCARNIDQYNGDAENITVTGHSAGGHLAAMCALTDWPGQYALPEKTVRAFAPISGLFDLEPISHISYMREDLRINERDIAEASPQRLIRRCSADMLITYGSDEPSEFSRHSEEFRQAWDDAGNRSRYFPQMGRNHFSAITDLGDPDTELTRAMLALMGHAPSVPYHPRAGQSGNWHPAQHAAQKTRIDHRLFPGRTR